jgi:hypothetical protein
MGATQSTPGDLNQAGPAAVRAGEASERTRKLAAVRAIIRHRSAGSFDPNDGVLNELIDAVEELTRSGAERRVEDRRHLDDSGDVAGDPIWRLEADADRRDHERRQAERRHDNAPL